MSQDFVNIIKVFWTYLIRFLYLITAKNLEHVPIEENDANEKEETYNSRFEGGKLGRIFELEEATRWSF